MVFFRSASVAHGIVQLSMPTMMQVMPREIHPSLSVVVRCCVQRISLNVVVALDVVVAVCETLDVGVFGVVVVLG